MLITMITTDNRLYPTNTIRSPNAVLLLAHRLRRYPNIKSTSIIDWFKVFCLLGDVLDPFPVSIYVWRS